MKNLIISLIAIFGLLVFTSCEDSMGPQVNSGGEAPSLSSHSGGENFVLNEEDADEELFTLSWEAPDFGFNAAVTYYIEMDVDGSDFEDPVTFAQTNSTSISMTVGEVNNRLNVAGVPFGVESEVPMRIRAHVSEDVKDRISEVFVFAFTPYEIIIEFPEIYVPGGYQSASGYTADWSPADAPALASVNSNDRYEGYVYFAADNQEFKFTAERNWNDGDWGGSEGSLEPGGGNLLVENAGYYKINVDLNNLTYALLATDWGLIGDATPGGWDADTDLTYDPADKVWRLTVDLTAGEIKFRANDAWDLNYGSDNADGTLAAGAGNIPIEEAGNYTVELDLSGPIYRYSLELN